MKRGKVIGSEGMRWAYQNTKIYQNGIERENWDSNYAYSIVMLIPTNKSLTGYRQGDKTGPNWHENATYETNYGIVTIEGNDYNVYGYRNPRSGYVVSDTTAPKNVFVEIS